MSHRAPKYVGASLLALVVVAIFYLLTKGKSILHESVQATLVLGYDPVTGAPQFDSNQTSTIPQRATVDPLPFPPDSTNPHDLTCPQGFDLWKDVSGGYHCVIAPQGTVN